MLDQSLTAVSPIDGRYQPLTAGLSAAFSEAALIRYRLGVEIEWLILMSERPEIGAVRALSDGEKSLLTRIAAEFGPEQAERVKEIEHATRHDVKAVEYYLGERLAGTSLAEMRPFIHFCCTSEDINNLAYARMLQAGVTQTWLPLARRMTAQVAALAEAARDVPMLARTHGQPATPTTVGKELAVFVRRWQRQLAQIEGTDYLGKFNGAVGAYNAHAVVYPDAPWEEISRQLVERLGLTWNPLTTQIEPHDYIAELMHGLLRFNTITLGFDQDIWTYISRGCFRQKVVRGEVGSSTMPHKVNPINFENSEANFGLSNALLSHLASKLPVSRMQRDLTDSSALRSVGSAVAYSVLALENTLVGLSKLQIDAETLRRELDGNWEVLAEPIQMVLRREGHADAYERLKDFSRGAALTQADVQDFIKSLGLPADDEKRLLALTPQTYIGIAPELVRHIEENKHKDIS
jgi:adenylosuccinate lyase